MFNNIKAAIFDLDGTLVDSMWVWDQIDIEYLNNKGIEVPENLNDEIAHLGFSQVANYFKERFNLEDSLDTIKDDWNSMAKEYYSNKIELKKGVVEFLRFLKDSKIKIGLATSNSKELLEAALKSNEIYEFFDSITITDEVGIGKHEPNVYLLSAEKMNVEPKDCIVFEDIVQAVKGAKKAGMRIIAIEDERSLNDKEELISLSDDYINDFNLLIPKEKDLVS